MPCVVCNRCKVRISWISYSRVEAAHVGFRGLGQKCPDRQTVPLCAFHHRAGPHAAHVLGRKFWDFWKLDRLRLIQEFNERYEREKAA